MSSSEEGEIRTPIEEMGFFQDQAQQPAQQQEDQQAQPQRAQRPEIRYQTRFFEKQSSKSNPLLTAEDGFEYIFEAASKLIQGKNANC